MRSILFFLTLLLAVGCTDDSSSKADTRIADTGQQDSSGSDAPTTPDSGPGPEASVDRGPKCGKLSCAMTGCGMCTCSWSCGKAKYQVNCNQAPTAACTCHKDGVKVGSCTAKSGSDSAACRANCCKFPI